MKNASKAMTSIQAKALCVVAKAEKRMKASTAPKPAEKAASKVVREPSTAPPTKALSGETVGIDVGDRVSQFCRLDAVGEFAGQGLYEQKQEQPGNLSTCHARFAEKGPQLSREECRSRRQQRLI